MSGVKRIFWNPSENRLRSGWRALVQLVLFLVAFFSFLILVGLQIVLPALGLSSFDELDALEATGAVPVWLVLVPGAATFLAALASTLAATRLLERRPLAAFGLRLDPHWWADLGFGVVLGALFTASIFSVLVAAGWLEVTGLFQTPVTGQPFALGLGAFLLNAVMVGTGEELVFRAYQLTALAQGLGRMGPRLAIGTAWLISSILFGLWHVPNTGATGTSVIIAVLGGFLLGAGYVLTGRLGLSIGLHAALNFFGDNVFGFGSGGGQIADRPTIIATSEVGPDLWTGGPFGPAAGLVAVGAILLGVVAIWLWARWEYGVSAPHLELVPAQQSVEQPERP